MSIFFFCSNLYPAFRLTFFPILKFSCLPFDTTRDYSDGQVYYSLNLSGRRLKRKCLTLLPSSIFQTTVFKQLQLFRTSIHRVRKVSDTLNFSLSAPETQVSDTSSIINLPNNCFQAATTVQNFRSPGEKGV
jgi:hypothetical protein